MEDTNIMVDIANGKNMVEQPDTKLKLDVLIQALGQDRFKIIMLETEITELKQQLMLLGKDTQNGDK